MWGEEVDEWWWVLELRLRHVEEGVFGGGVFVLLKIVLIIIS